MRDWTAPETRRYVLIAFIALAAPIVLSVAMLGCGSSKTAAPSADQPAQQPAAGPQRYHLAGRVVSIEAAKKQVVVDAEDIPGFMAAMKMGYPVKDPNILAPLSPEDQITADVVVNGNDMYLENIQVVKKAAGAKPAAGSGAPASSSPPAKLY